MPGAHSRNVSRELRESSEGARVAILLAADDVEGGVAEQGLAELSAAERSADPPQLLPASDEMGAGPSSHASDAAQGGASCQGWHCTEAPCRGGSLNIHVCLWSAKNCFSVLPRGPASASTSISGS